MTYKLLPLPPWPSLERYGHFRFKFGEKVQPTCLSVAGVVNGYNPCNDTYTIVIDVAPGSKPECSAEASERLYQLNLGLPCQWRINERPHRLTGSSAFVLTPLILSCLDQINDIKTRWLSLIDSNLNQHTRHARATTSNENHTVLEWADLQGIEGIEGNEGIRHGIRLSRICRAAGLMIGERLDRSGFVVNAYPEHLLAYFYRPHD